VQRCNSYCTYSKALTQSWPRRCLMCREVEPGFKDDFVVSAHIYGGKWDNLDIASREPDPLPSRYLAFLTEQPLERKELRRWYSEQRANQAIPVSPSDPGPSSDPP
jgi:hypothetical protein